MESALSSLLSESVLPESLSDVFSLPELSEEVHAFLTVTLHLYVLWSTVAVMVAVPAFFAVILPEELTVATLFLEELHFIF